MFLEAILGAGDGSGGGGTVVEEGDFTVSSSSAQAIPCQTNDYDYLIAYYKELPPSGGFTNGYYYEHVESKPRGSYIKLQTDVNPPEEAEITTLVSLAKLDIGWYQNHQVVNTAGSQKVILNPVTLGTWHYKAIKFNS